VRLTSAPGRSLVLFGLLRVPSLSVSRRVSCTNPCTEPGPDLLANPTVSVARLSVSMFQPGMSVPPGMLGGMGDEQPAVGQVARQVVVNVAAGLAGYLGTGPGAIAAGTAPIVIATFDYISGTMPPIRLDGFASPAGLRAVFWRGQVPPGADGIGDSTGVDRERLFPVFPSCFEIAPCRHNVGATLV